MDDLERGYQKIVLVWFDDKIPRQTDSVKASCYRKLFSMISNEMSSCFIVNDMKRIAELWFIFVSCMKAITIFPEVADMENLEKRFTEYNIKYCNNQEGSDLT